MSSTVAHCAEANQTDQHQDMNWRNPNAKMMASRTDKKRSKNPSRVVQSDALCFILYLLPTKQSNLQLKENVTEIDTKWDGSCISG